MEVRNLIQSNATVVQITEVKAGDIYKRLVENSYQEPKIVCGSIIDVMSNGEAATLVALEFSIQGYGTQIESTTKVFTDKTEVTLFPVALEEFRAHLSKAIDMQEKAIEVAERDLKAKESVLQAMYGQVRAALAPAKTKEVQA